MVAGRRQVHQLLRRAAQRGIAQLVGEREDGIVVGHVKRAITPAETRGRSEAIALAQDMAFFRLAIAIRVTQQHQPVWRTFLSPRPAHQELGNQCLQPIAEVALGRIGFGRNDVAIGQNQDDPGMMQTFGKAVYHQPLCGGRRFSSRPANRLGDADRGEMLHLRFDDQRIAARQFIGRMFRRGWTRQDIAEAKQDDEDGEAAKQPLAGSGHGATDKRPKPRRQWTF